MQKGTELTKARHISTENKKTAPTKELFH